MKKIVINNFKDYEELCDEENDRHEKRMHDLIIALYKVQKKCKHPKITNYPNSIEDLDVCDLCGKAV